jgi:hypothetical protein
LILADVFKPIWADKTQPIPLFPVAFVAMSMLFYLCILRLAVNWQY